MKAISEVGGHSRPDTTLVFYQHVSREQHHEAVGKIQSVAIPPAPGKVVKKAKKSVLPFTTFPVVAEK